MRTIKFRGKRIDDDIWVDGDLITTLTPKGSMIMCPAIHTTDGTIGTFFVHPETVGQFTGLYDNNGKEIYEGDIVKWSDKYQPKTILWFLCQFDAGNKESSMPLLDLKDKYSIENIGNVYDNPDLLANHQ